MPHYHIHRRKDGATGLYRGRKCILYGDRQTIYTLRAALDAMRKMERS